MSVTHESWCQHKAFGHSDAAKRLCDTYNLHRIAGGLYAVRKWFAVALADGRSDDVLYDDKQSAVRHQHHNENYYAFICIAPCGMKECEAEVVLTNHRMLYDAGFRLADPDHRSGGKEVIKRLAVEDQLAQTRGRNTNLIMPWE